MPTEAEDRNEAELEVAIAIAVAVEVELEPLVDAVVGEAGEKSGHHFAGSGLLTMMLLLLLKESCGENVAEVDLQHPLGVSCALQQQQQQRPGQQLKAK